MAWLYIDTHALGLFEIGTIESNGQNRFHSYTGRGHQLLARIATWLKDTKPKGVCVVAGPGSFSSVRTGVLVANLLARLWRVPLVGLRVDEAEDKTQLGSMLKTRAKKSSLYIAPIYNAEPNITVPKPRS